MMECDCENLLDQKLLWSSDQCVCTTCARVVDAHPMEQGPEWFEDQHARCSPVGRNDTFVPDLPSVIVEGTKRAPPDPHKSLRTGLHDVDACAILIGLTPDHQMTVRAKQVFSDFVSAQKSAKRTIRKRDLRMYAAVSVYFGCKIHEHECARNPRTIQEIAAKCQVPPKQCTDAVKLFKTLLRHEPYGPLLFRTVTANDLFTRALQSVPLTPKEKCKVLNVCKELYSTTNDILAGRTPETICCVCLFMACEKMGIAVERSVIYNACAVSSTTLKNALSFLKTRIHLRKPMKEINT